MSHFNSRAKQQIYEQIQKRLVDKIMQEEIQKLERQQEVVKQEKSYLEDLKVHPIKRSPHHYLYKLNSRGCNALSAPLIPSCVLAGSGEEEGGTMALA